MLCPCSMHVIRLMSSPTEGYKEHRKAAAHLHAAPTAERTGSVIPPEVDTETGTFARILHVRLRSRYVRTETARSATEPIRSARCVRKFGRKVHVRKSAENPSEFSERHPPARAGRARRPVTKAASFKTVKCWKVPSLLQGTCVQPSTCEKLTRFGTSLWSL